MTSGLPHRMRVRPQPVQRRARVCVVVPLYNYARYVEGCLRSVLDQEGVDPSVIVLDDASRDDSLATVRRLAEGEPRIRVVAHERNRGHIPTVNEGMGLADAEYVVKLDADDLLTPGSLARSVALLDAYPSTGFVYGFPFVFRTAEPPAPRLDTTSWSLWPGRQWLARTCRRGTNVIKQPEVVIRTEALRSCGPYREQLPHTSDFEMWMRLAARFDVGRINGPHQGFYREHAQSMSQTDHGGVLTDIAERLRGFESFFSGCSALVPDAPALSTTAHRALAYEALGYAISAYARGIAEDEPIDGYAELAVKAWPDVTGTRPWRALQRVRAMDPGRLRRDPAVVVREAVRDVRFRIMWRRWRWRGV